MAMIALLLAIFLVNRVSPLTRVTTSSSKNEVNVLPEGRSAFFALQIQQIRPTSEATPAASIGNNLNVIGGSKTSNPDVQRENFQAISTVYTLKSSKDKKYEGGGENVDLFPLFDENIGSNKIESLQVLEKNEQEAKALPLVWDNCLETTFRESQVNVLRNPDMENIHSDFPLQSKKLNGSFWNKRNVGAKNAESIKMWLEKYNDLKNSKTEERRQQKPESILIKKITESYSSTLTPVPTSREPSSIPSSSLSFDISPFIKETMPTHTTIKIIPITREVFKEPNAQNATQSYFITDSDIVTSYTEDWYDPKDRTRIRFSDLPQRETYLIPTLRLEEGFHPFGFMSRFFYFIYPFDFPVGLIKDIVWGEFTFPYSFLQAIKVESTFLAFIIVFACVALVIPSYLIILGILSLFSRSSCDDELETGALFPNVEESDCNDRAFVVVTLIIVLLSCIVISGMEVSNEQAHIAATEGRNMISCACSDISTWLTSAARELHLSLVPPVDLVLHAYHEDLRNVEILLAEPIQQAIASESGIDLVFDSLTDIIAESEDLSKKISSLRDVCVKANTLASAASERIKDIAHQLEGLKKECTMKDLPLCDTVNTNSMEMKMKFDLILQEQQLLELRTLGVHNLTQAIAIARKQFRILPSAISMQTIHVREDILKDIERRRETVHASAKILTDIVRHLTSGLHTLARQLETGMKRIQIYEFGRWIIMLACITLFGLVMLLILLAMLCGCGNAKAHGKRTLKASALCLCLTSLILWGMVSAIFLISGHAEVYVCHALWDSPQYNTLTALLDRPSPLLVENQGIFDALFKELENITIDVSVNDVLRDCERDRPAYVVFQLDKVLDVNKETSYFEWGELQADLGRLSSSIDVAMLKTVTVNFNKLLNDMLVVSDVNLAKYRMDYNVPVVGKDLPSLVDQLENVAAQLTDLTTAGRLETLASRTQRLYLTSIKPLEQLRADVVFKLTELELQLMPFRRKLNISLSHIHTAQFYIDNQGDVIAQKKVSTYVSRLISHAAGWRTHVLVSAGKHAARCKPLFAVYAAVRSLLCSDYVASLHGWWVCGVILGILWCTALAPLCVKLWRSYGKKIRAHEALSLSNMSGQQETPTTALCDSSNWNTTGPPPPPRNDSW